MTVAEFIVKLVFQSNDPQALPRLKGGLQGAKAEADKLAVGITAVNAGLTAMNNAGQKAFVVLSQFQRASGGSVLRLGPALALPSGPTIAGQPNYLAPYGVLGPSGFGGAGGSGGGFTAPGFGGAGGGSPINPANLKEAAKGVTLFALAIDALNIGMTKIVESTGEAARLLTGFRVNTGGDTQGLQKLAGSLQVQGVGTGETMSMVKTIRDTQASVRLGTGNAAPFQFFGISATETDMNKILAQVQKMSKVLDPNLARQFAQQLGITDNIFQGLMQANLADTGLIMSDADIARMKTFNEDWNRLGRNVTQFGQQIGTILAPAFEDVIRALEWLVARGEDFTTWLKQPYAAGFRVVIEGLVVALLALGAVLPVIAAGLLALFAIFAFPQLAIFTAGVLALGAALGLVDSAVEGIVEGLAEIPFLGDLITGVPSDYVGATQKYPRGGNQTVTQHNTVNVTGDQPHEIARQVSAHLKGHLTNAFANTPLPAY